MVSIRYGPFSPCIVNDDRLPMRTFNENAEWMVLSLISWLMKQLVNGDKRLREYLRYDRVHRITVLSAALALN